MSHRFGNAYRGEKNRGGDMGTSRTGVQQEIQMDVSF